jgi:endonuclease/exonuclease/phosphatase family metal-dependent hydrolase
MGAVEFKDVVYCVTHLDHVSATDRLSGVETITKWAKENYSNASKPVFLVGDMNATPTSETVQKLQEDWVWISPDRNTFPSRTLTKCIDYILVLKNGYESKVEVTASGVVTSSVNPLTYNASDHCPVWVTAKWNTAQ